MSQHLLDAARNLISSDWLLKVATQTGESPDSVKSAMGPVLATVLGGFASKASTTDGATQLVSLLSKGQGGLLEGGKAILEMLFGARLKSVVDLIENATGLRGNSSATLLSAGAGMVASAVASARRDEHLDAHGLATLLAGEKHAAMKFAPAGLSQIVESGGYSFRHIAPMLASGAFLLAAPFLFRACERRPPAVEEVHAKPAIVAAPKPDPAVAQNLELPGGASITVKPGTINYELVQFLKSSEPVPKTFVFDNLNFETGTTVVTPASRPTISDLLAILKAYPAVDVRLEGHTDNQGQPAANLKLSRDRAAAIDKVLETGGIAAPRITTEGFGQDKPMAPNETEEGRAKNRRLELVVVKK